MVTGILSFQRTDMLGHLQLLIIISFLVITGLAVGGGFYVYNAATDNFAHSTEVDGNALAQGYVNTVWRKYREVVVPLSGNPENLKGNPQVVEFAQETLRYFQRLPLIRVNIYSGNGVLLMTDNVSTTNKWTARTASPDKSFIMVGLKQADAPHSQVLSDVALEGIEHATVIQTLLPVKIDNQPPEAAIEIIFNVTDTWDKLTNFAIAGTCVVVCVLTFLLLMVSLVGRRAEAIISRQHEANLELTQTAAIAMAENREKSQFLTNISHELRTPLNAIIGFSDIIKTEVLPILTERKYDQYLNDIHSSGVHLLSLINDILDYSKAEAGKLVLEVSEVDVTKMVQNSMRLVSPRAETGNVKLVEEMPKEHVIMIIDGKKFRQILLNLLSNAVKFTPAGGFVSVTAWLNVVDDTVTFEVRDTGIGIAPKDISRAMSPFGQVDNTLKRKYEGTGLGLPLTKKLVEIMGGKFNIESVVGKGTKVIFTLPRVTVERDGITVKQAA